MIYAEGWHVKSWIWIARKVDYGSAYFPVGPIQSQIPETFFPKGSPSLSSPFSKTPTSILPLFKGGSRGISILNNPSLQFIFPLS